MPYLFEIHYHTPYTSSCGKLYPDKAIPEYIKKGYSGVVVTDHFHHDYFKSLGDISWKEKVDCFLEGYRKTKEYCKNKDFVVLLGMEIRFEGSINDYLVYGFDEQFLYDNENLYDIRPEDFYEKCKNNGFYFGQAHPFRNKCFPLNPDYLMGVEVYNGHPGHTNRNDRALEMAKKHNLIMTSGSDMHEEWALCRAGMYFKEKPETSKQLAENLLKGKIEGIKKSE